MTTQRLIPACALALVCSTVAFAQSGASTWRTDPAWQRGKAEWALYDAVRPIYDEERRYEATIFTNVQHMDPATTTKATDWRDPGAVEVFKHNLSEIIPTENYAYRFLTTGFVRRDTLETYKLVASTQEDCGATFKRFVVADGRVDASSFCYFPEGGETSETYRVPGFPENFTFHDTLSLRLRDYPFDAATKPELKLKLIPDQTDTHETPLRPEEATVRYVERETLTLPYGSVDAHHLVVTHARHGGATESHFWFAADARGMRHAMVKYRGPFGVEYELKRLAWWAYWGEPRPE